MVYAFKPYYQSLHVLNNFACILGSRTLNRISPLSMTMTLCLKFLDLEKRLCPNIIR